MPDQTPLYQVHQALWTILVADADFASTVPAGNRVDYTTTTENAPGQDRYLTAYPVVEILPSDDDRWLLRGSNQSMWGAMFDIVSRTGKQNVKTLLDLNFYIYRALINWETTLNALTWNSKQFVRALRSAQAHGAVMSGSSNAENVLGNVKLDKGPKGWVSIWRCQVDMWFDHTDLIRAAGT